MAKSKKSARKTSTRKPASASQRKPVSQRSPSSTAKSSTSTRKSSSAARRSTPQPAQRKKSPASTRKLTRKKGLAGGTSASRSRAGASRASTTLATTLDALNEQIDIMLPEVMFRIAALEHLLVKNQLCSYDELLNARQYIQEQEAS